MEYDDGSLWEDYDNYLDYYEEYEDYPQRQVNEHYDGEFSTVAINIYEFPSFYLQLAESISEVITN